MEHFIIFQGCNNGFLKFWVNMKFSSSIPLLDKGDHRTYRATKFSLSRTWSPSFLQKGCPTFLARHVTMQLWNGRFESCCKAAWSNHMLQTYLYVTPSGSHTIKGALRTQTQSSLSVTSHVPGGMYVQGGWLRVVGKLGPKTWKHNCSV